MSMEGDLSSLQVGELLQMLQFGSKSGALLLSRGREDVVMWLERGCIQSMYSRRGLRLSLASTMDLEGLARPEQLQAWRTTAPTEERWLEQLGSGAFLEHSRIQGLLSRHTLRLLVEVTAWDTGQFLFDKKGPGQRPSLELKPAVELGGVLLEVMRRRDDSNSVAAECRNRGIVFHRGRVGKTVVSTRAQRLLSLLGRESDIDRIFEASFQSQYEALEAARELVLAKLLLLRSEHGRVSLERSFWDGSPEELAASRPLASAPDARPTFLAGELLESDSPQPAEPVQEAAVAVESIEPPPDATPHEQVQSWPASLGEMLHSPPPPPAWSAHVLAGGPVDL